MAQTMNDNVAALAVRIGQECRSLQNQIGTIGSLTTTAKDNLVNAINELLVKINDVNSAAGAIVDDSKTATDSTYSSTKIEDLIAEAARALKTDLLGGAGEAYDTLKELADLIENNKDAIDALEALAAGHVIYDGAQTLTEAEKQQARTNIGAVSQADFDSLEAELGDLDHDFVADFEGALNPTD